MPGTLAEPVLTLAISNLEKSIHSTSDIYTVWTVFTKCKDNLQNGRRLENMSWRLWYRSASLALKKDPSSLAFPSENDCKKEIMSAIFQQEKEIRSSSKTTTGHDEINTVSSTIKKMVVQPCSLEDDSDAFLIRKQSVKEVVIPEEPVSVDQEQEYSTPAESMMPLLQNPLGVHHIPIQQQQQQQPEPQIPFHETPYSPLSSSLEGVYKAYPAFPQHYHQQVTSRIQEIESSLKRSSSGKRRMVQQMSSLQHHHTTLIQDDTLRPTLDSGFSVSDEPSHRSPVVATVLDSDTTNEKGKPSTAMFFISSSSVSEQEDSLYSDHVVSPVSGPKTCVAIPDLITEEPDMDEEEDEDEPAILCPLAQRVCHMASSIELAKERHHIGPLSYVSDEHELMEQQQLPRDEDEDDWGSSYSDDISCTEEEEDEDDDMSSCQDDDHDDDDFALQMHPRNRSGSSGMTLFQKQSLGYTTFVKSQRRSLLSVALQRSALKRSRPSQFRNLSTLSAHLHQNQNASDDAVLMSPTRSSVSHHSTAQDTTQTTDLSNAAPLDAVLDMAVSESLRAHIQQERLAFQQFLHAAHVMNDARGGRSRSPLSPRGLFGQSDVTSSSFPCW